jgi:cation transport ATPase
LTNVLSLNGVDQGDVLSLAAGVEATSEHPSLARYSPACAIAG